MYRNKRSLPKIQDDLNKGRIELFVMVPFSGLFGSSCAILGGSSGTSWKGSAEKGRIGGEICHLV